MNKKRIIYHILSIFFLTVPNLVYLLCNFNVLKETNIISLTMVAMLILSVIGIGALTHVKLKAGIWIILVGLFMLIMSNISLIGAVALIIEGGGMVVDGYIFKPLIDKSKVKEFEENGGTITYTKEFK